MTAVRTQVEDLRVDALLVADRAGTDRRCSALLASTGSTSRGRCRRA